MTGKVPSACAEFDLPPANKSKLQAATIQFSDRVEQDDWNGAAEQLRRVCAAAKPILVRFDADSEPLTKIILRLGRAVQRHDRAGALHADNKLTEWLAVTFRRPGVPTEVAHLGYLARELRLLAAEDKAKKSAARATEVRTCWNGLVAALNPERDPTLRDDGEAVVHQLELATPADLPSVQASLERLVERINQAFDQAKE